MGQTLPHALGRNERAFLKSEPVYGTFVPPTANDSATGQGEIKLLGSTVSIVPNRIDRADKRLTRSLEERIDGFETVEFGMEMYILPVAAGTVPDAGFAFKNWLGIQNIRVFLTVVAFGNGATDTVTITIDGSPTVLTEGSEFTAETSNDVTAANIATAISLIAGVTATATLAVVTVLGIETLETLAIATGDVTAWTATPTADVQYTLTREQDGHGSFSYVRYVPDGSTENLGVVMEAVTGAAIQEGTITIAGGDPPQFSASGFASKHFHTGASTLDGALSGGESSVTVDDPDNYEIDSVFAIFRASTGVLDNGTGDGYRVTLNTAGVLDITPNIVLAADDADLVVPFAPADTTTGSPVAGINGSFSIGPTGSLVQVPVTAFELSVSNEHSPFDDEFGEQNVTDYVPMFRVVSGSITMRARRDVMEFLGTRKTFAVQDLQIIAGLADGTQIQMDITCELEFEPLDIPGDTEAIITLRYRGISSVGEGEVIVTFT